VEVTVPDIGDYQQVPVIEVLVKDGDRVDKDAPLIVLESEKATMEVPAPAAGIVRGLKVKPGAKVSKGDPICTLEPAAGETPQPVPAQPKPPLDAGPREEPAPPKPSSAPSPKAPADPPWVGQAQGEIPHASPAVRKLAREFGVDLARVTGGGPSGRILHEDVQQFVKQSLGGAAPAGGGGIPPVPAVDFAQFGEIEKKPLARIRKISAQHLHRAWLNIPHVTQTDNADITELESFRKSQSDESGVKLTLLPFIMKAVSVALKAFPEFNASLAADGESLILKKYCHLGFAADTPNGLVVPVVRDVWSKGIVQLAGECGELAKKARDGKLKADEMKGGCFSISSLGGIGGSHFTPIVNAPEVAILGVSRAQMQPVWNGKEFAPRLMCPLSLSYDHRVIDGAYAARFVVALSKLLADLRRAAL
jgi:pyruvate dehydrogenase E2 component (dihydrolipoamide acetyltransferase)